ncbi:putative WD repeat-containing protein [Zancudomyces culisetae]|uniref:Putative WD repeat-containing protein n=1 Tax=Zancudomyces culisetae TaxID=1213189 RepID=A0A1R1PM17_ZANCU|nr:putative WD repeat-containing protein [Zancudomyces culisetae]|eukprot:OMH82005.1 putative WD repeat-containing protein [Zancudomyces culisetae]
MAFFQSNQQIEKEKQRLVKLQNLLERDLGKTGTNVKAKILSMAKSLDGRNKMTVWVGLGDFTARKISVGDDKCKQIVLRGHKGPVTCIGVVPKYAKGNTDSTEQEVPEYVLTGSWDKTIRMWDPQTQQTVAVFDGHSDFIKCLEVDLHTQTMYSGSSDKTIKVWDYSAAIPSSSIENTNANSKPVSIRPIQTIKDDQLIRGPINKLLVNDELYSVGSDSKVIRWELENPNDGNTNRRLTKKHTIYSGHLTSVYSINVTDNSIWTGSADKFALEFDKLNNTKAQTKFEHTDPIKSVLVIPQQPYNNLFLAGDKERNLHIWKSDSDKSMLEAHLDSIESILLVNLNKNEPTVLTGSIDGYVKAWSVPDLFSFKNDDVPANIPLNNQDIAPNGLTADEDKELQDLLDELDDDY